MKSKVMAVLAVAMLGGTLLSAPANAAAVSTGVKCTKEKATTKVGSKVYRCGKNPYFKPTQLTWTLRGCFTAYALWQSSKKQYEDFKDIAKLAGAEGEKTMNDLLASIAALEDTMKNEACKKGA
jgi:hypothetical protein